MDWKDKTFSLSYLDDKVLRYENSPLRQETTAMGFLAWAEIVPEGLTWRRSNSNTKTNLDGNSIRAGYLAELAYDWDKDGLSTPRDFVDSLSFEVADHPKNQNVSEVLGELGRP